MKNHNNISKTKISNVTIKMNHRPSETNDLSLSIGMGSLMNIDKTAEGMDNESSSKDKKVLIKVNTKCHQLAGNLSNINTSKTKRVINLKENGLFQNLNEINKMNHKSPKNKKNEYDNDMKKITLIQNWWKNIYDKNKKKFNSFSYLVVCIKKVFCLKIFELIQNKFPSIDYFFHKWNDKVTKLKIINRLLKKLKKTRNKKDKIDINNKLDKKSTNKSNQEKSKDKSQKSKLLKNKKKSNLILNNVIIETTKTKECQTTKHNKKKNLINFTLNTNAFYNNKKKTTPYSPKMISSTQRQISPINILNKNLCIQKPKKTDLEKNISSLNKDNNKNKEKKSNKLNEINNEKNSKKKHGEKINKLKVSKNSDYNKQSNTASSKNENQLTFVENPPNLQSSRINSYILNIEKKDMNINQMYCNYNKKPKKDNRLSNNSTKNNNNNNNKSLHFNTEVNSNKINSIFKMNKQNTKVYENCLYKDNKYQNYYSPINTKLYSKINHKDNLVLFNKNVILIQKEKGKLSSVKDLNSHKKKKFTYNTISETNSTLSKVSSIDNTSHRIMQKKLKNINIYKYFFYWKEYVDKKNIVKKLCINSKFVYYINHLTNNILLKKSLEKLIRIYKKEKLYYCCKNMAIKLIINIIKKVAEYKNNYSNEKNIKNSDKFFYQKKGTGDIINNININNYINYEDYKLFHKRKARSPKLIQKIKKSKTINNNSQFNYYYSTKLSLSNSSSSKIIDFDFNKQKMPISINAFDYNDNYNIIDEENNYGNITNYNQKYNGYMNKRCIYHNYSNIDNKTQKIEDGVIVDQINQLKMVFNLLERHNTKNNQSITKISLSNCFNKWKLFLFNNNLCPHKINEKIINLKPFQNSKIIQSAIGSPIDISLKKKFKENKSSPKIINVINVQNYNENNNYNYNFKCLPIKNSPIYALNQRNSYDCYNIDKLNSDFTNLTYNDNNVINASVNNNFNLNTTSFFILNDNKNSNQNIVYHKKRLDKTYINHNSNNILVNECNLNNFYKYNKGNYASSLYFIGHNKSQIILPDFDSKIYNLKKNTKINQSQSNFRDNSFNNIPSCIHQDPFPELKYGFEKKNHIEEKEINFFENINNTNNKNNQNIYVKKQSGDSKKSKFNSNNNKCIKTSMFNFDEDNKKNRNLIKTLNIQFDNSNEQLDNNGKDNNKFITIIKDKEQDNKKINADKYSKSSLGIKNYKNIFEDKKIKYSHKYRTTNIIKDLNKKVYCNDNSSVAEFDIRDPIQKKINQTFIFYPKLLEDFEEPNLKVNFNTI